MTTTGTPVTQFNQYTSFLSQLFVTCVYMWVQDMYGSSFGGNKRRNGRLLLIIVVGHTHSNKFGSRAWFRSMDLWDMGPARFHSALSALWCGKLCLGYREIHRPPWIIWRDIALRQWQILHSFESHPGGTLRITSRASWLNRPHQGLLSTWGVQLDNLHWTSPSRLIGLVKGHLRRALWHRPVSLEQFWTILCRIGGIVNDRPLFHPSSDPMDILPFRPSDFLHPHLHSDIPCLGDLDAWPAYPSLPIGITCWKLFVYRKIV